ncbi:putative gustatory receptor clone PTE01 [Denticeps clupeoides]|uniref:putative gustatory receptor clone PTE01 n=1 Tax=Denticeps clupeoides TaxID=299321 RepID=UPI0010A3790B|nr:putative gustatory receptor clone PTE01 [Denticeps clupeoides]
MENESFPFYFHFTLYKDYGGLKYLFFLLLIIVYLAILLLNVSIIWMVYKERSLHEPMYLFIACLSANAIYGSSGLFPRLFIDVLSDSHSISYDACSSQIFVIYTYGICEFTMLTIMAYDRCVAICYPLRYHSIMTPRTTGLLIAAGVSWPIVCKSIVTYFTARLPLCGREITRLYCSTWSVARLSCVSTAGNNAMGLFFTVVTIFLLVAFILYTYIRILLVCRRSSSEFRGKALQTSLPHIVTVVTYSLSSFCDILLSRFELGQALNIVTLLFSVEVLLVPPILNPLIYGLALPEIRKKIINRLKNASNPHK